MQRLQARRPGIILRLSPALLCMAAIFALSSRSTLPKPESLSGQVFSILGHFGAYFLLGVTLWWAFGLFSMTPRSRMLIAWAGAVLYGVTDEWHQSFVPGRTPDVRDIVTDAIGALVGSLVVSLLLRRTDRVDWMAR